MTKPKIIKGTGGLMAGGKHTMSKEMAEYACFAWTKSGPARQAGYNPLVVKATSKAEARRIAQASLPSCSRWSIRLAEHEEEK